MLATTRDVEGLPVDNGDFVSSLSQAIVAPVLDLSSDNAFVVYFLLHDRIAELGRRSLVLVGGLLDGAVTQIALPTLLEGYDVYVCAGRIFRHRSLTRIYES